MTDPIADMLTRIRNAQAVRKDEVVVPHSKIKEGIARTLRDENYIEDYQILETPYGQPNLVLKLKYMGKNPLISELKRISKPGRRVYLKSKKIMPVLSGHGLLIVSTNQGIMTGKAAKKQNIGGEVLCHIW